jgi:hypothetical protein
MLKASSLEKWGGRSLAMLSRRGFCTGVYLALVAGCSSPGADRTPDGVTNSQTQDLSSAEVAVELPGEGRSPQALVVRWQSLGGDAKLGALAATVSNTTGSDLVAELFVAVTSPDGQFVQHSLGLYKLAAKATEELTLEAKGLPIQSAGAASAVQIIATYDPGDNAIVGTPVAEKAPVSSYSPLAYVTHDDTFAAVTARTSAEEADINGAAYEAGQHPRLKEVRGVAATPISAALAERTPLQFTRISSQDGPDSPTTEVK